MQIFVTHTSIIIVLYYTIWLDTGVFAVFCDIETDMVVHKECIEKARCVMGKKSYL